MCETTFLNTFCCCYDTLLRISNWMKVGDNHEKYLRKHKNSHKLRNPNLLLLHSFPMTCFLLEFCSQFGICLCIASHLCDSDAEGKKIRNAMHFSVMVFATISDHPEMYRSHFFASRKINEHF